MGGNLASPTNDSRVVAKIFKKVIPPHCRVSWVLITDNMTHFIEKKLEVLLRKYEVHHNNGLYYHLQTGG